jgi:hypothetical protein
VLYSLKSLLLTLFFTLLRSKKADFQEGVAFKLLSNGHQIGNLEYVLSLLVVIDQFLMLWKRTDFLDLIATVE